MIRRSALAILLLAAPLSHASGDDPDGLVLLPGQGELRDRADRERAGTDRLKPGGGLFVSFDADTDGTITIEEVRAAIPAAFATADQNEDGNLSALEQQDWARSLPTRDDSLANPTRFDPNLDRRVDLAEFAAVIESLHTDYRNEETGLLQLTDLKAPKQRLTRNDRRGENILEERSEAERRRRERIQR
ncbi:MAG: hypothetical protein AAGG45_03455 [Pseudomonadota bacterium]